MNKSEKCCSSSIKEFLLNILKKSFILFIETFFAFSCLAIILYFLGNYCPKTYNFLTSWANNPKLSQVVKCEVISDPVLRHSDEILEMRSLIYVENHTEQKIDLFFITETSGVGIRSLTNQAISNDETVVALRNIPFNEEIKSFEIIFEFNKESNFYEQFKNHKAHEIINRDNCPIEILTREV